MKLSLLIFCYTHRSAPYPVVIWEDSSGSRWEHRQSPTASCYASRDCTLVVSIRSLSVIFGEPTEERELRLWESKGWRTWTAESTKQGLFWLTGAEAASLSPAWTHHHSTYMLWLLDWCFCATPDKGSGCLWLFGFLVGLCPPRTLLSALFFVLSSLVAPYWRPDLSWKGSKRNGSVVEGGRWGN